jgi:hypothetical protein
MKRLLVVAGCALLTSGLAWTQEREKIELGPTMPRINAVAGSYQEFGWMSGTTKGAPFTAQQSTESTQTLADGTHITRTNTVTYIRDSQGRVRREDPNSISITDPVGGMTYRFEKGSHSGMKAPLLHNSVVIFDNSGLSYNLELKEKAQALVKEQQDSADQEKRIGEAVTAGVAREDQQKIELEAGAREKMTAAGGGRGGRGTITPMDNKNETQESLGSQMMEGVMVDGTRTTVVIPAGQIGNDRPIAIVTERWYSPELQITVMSRHTDPRLGETITKYTGIQRAEPDSALFQVPAGYTLREEPRRVVKDLQ